MPYFTLGYPDPETSFEIVQAVAASGADLIELGLPFSDPLADGPTIQHSTQLALEGGMTITRCLEQAMNLRRAGVSLPLLLMGYYNPILAFGTARFAAAAAAAGADGLIVPDLPVEEATELEAACRERGLALVYLLAPTSASKRARLLGQHSSGFLYLVSLTGVTGAREALGADLGAFIERVRAETSLPLAVGFGISTPEQAAAVGRLAEGVIVGSALISAVRRAVEAGQDPRQAAGEFVGSLRAALESSREVV
jgi:tryptophan synthase alpha chain